MKAIQLEIEESIDEFLAILDRDIEQLRRSIERLNDLRALVIKRDDKSLHNLLLVIRTDSQEYRDNESRRQSIRARLAHALGCSLREMTLSRLQTIAGEHKRSRISETADNLRTLGASLRTQHAATTLLLADCARFNKQLLHCILNRSHGREITYNASGAAKTQVDTGFMNLRF
jgi:predicted ATP-dependent endonuclease of OLD family